MTTEVNFVTIKESIPQTISKLQSVSQHKKSLVARKAFATYHILRLVVY